MLGEAAERLTEEKKAESKKKPAALPHSTHQSGSPKHPFIHFHMTVSMGTTRNSFTSEPELFITISLSVCTIIYVLQLWIKPCERAKLQMKYKKFMLFKSRAESFQHDPLDNFRLFFLFKKKKTVIVKGLEHRRNTV